LVVINWKTDRINHEIEKLSKLIFKTFNYVSTQDGPKNLWRKTLCQRGSSKTNFKVITKVIQPNVQLLSTDQIFFAWLKGLGGHFLCMQIAVKLLRTLPIPEITTMSK
jgi:hypothetical protein